jgi:hypothetical protein
LIATDAALTVNGALLVGTTNVATALGEKATTAALDLKAPKESPTFTGTATAAALTVNGALLAGTTNVMSALNLKANTSDVYTRAQMESDFQTKIDSFDAPLKFTENVLSSFNTLSIDPTAALSIGDVECSGTLRVDTIQKKRPTTFKLIPTFQLLGIYLQMEIWMLIWIYPAGN